MNVTLEDLNELKNQSTFAYVILENIIIKRELDETINKLDEANETIFSLNNSDDDSSAIEELIKPNITESISNSDEIIIEADISFDQIDSSILPFNADKSLFQQYCRCELKRNTHPDISLKYKSIFYKECCYGYTDHDLRGEL